MLILRAKHVLTDPGCKRDGLLNDIEVVIEGGKIKEVLPAGGAARSRYPDAQVLGNGSQLLMPGLIDAHSHGRGLSVTQKGSRNDFLENSLFDWAEMVPLPPELSAAMCAYRHLRSGCTTVHHNGFDDDVSGEQVACRAIREYLRSGIRLAFSPGFRNESKLAMDEMGFFATLPPDLQKFAEPQVSYDKQELEDKYFEIFDSLYRQFNNDDTRILLSPSWAHGATPSLLRRIREESDRRAGVKIHSHVLQTPIQKSYSFRRHGKSVVQWLDDIGFLGPNVVFGHAIHVVEGDIALMASRKVSITHHPSCNLHMRNGLAPVMEYLKAGVVVAMGMDDKTINDDEDAFMETRMIHKLHRSSTFELKQAPMDAYTAFEISTTNGAQVCGFAESIGKISPGMKADVILVDLDRISKDPWLDSRTDIIEALVHRGLGHDVSTVVVGGQVVVHDRKFTRLDTDALFREVREFCEHGISASQGVKAARYQQLKPYMQAWYESWQETT